MNWLAAAAVLLFVLVLVTIRGYGMMRVGWWNLSRLRELKRLEEESRDPAEKKALASLIQHCEDLRQKWVLGEPDLHVFANSRDLIREIAGHYHPQS